MKMISFLPVVLCAFLLCISCDYETIVKENPKPNTFEPTIITPPDYPKDLEDEESEQEKICALIQAAYDLYGVTAYIDFFDEDLDALLQIGNPTQPQQEEIEELLIDGMENMLAADEDFEEAFNSVVSIELDEEDFNNYADNCTPTLRWCWICSELACRNATGATIFGALTLNGSLFVLGLLGQTIHCQH
jgi:hypothetical protein